MTFQEFLARDHREPITLVELHPSVNLSGFVPVARNMIMADPGGDATKDLKFLSTTSGTVIYDTAQSFVGPGAYKLSTGAGPANATGSYIGVLSDSGRRIVVRFRFNTLPAATSTFLRIYKSDGTTVVADLNMTTGGLLQIAPTGATAVTGVTALSTNTWYQISLAYRIASPTSFRFQLYLGSTSSQIAEANATAGTLTNTGTDTLELRAAAAAGTNHDHWFDCIHVDNVGDYSYPGDVRSTAKLPTTRTASGFTVTGGTGAVDERPLSTTNYRQAP